MVPKRWRNNPFVLKVLGGVVCLILASQNQAGGPQVAPLFLHGEGRGTFGCVAVNPPVFLTEDEARQVIAEEVQKVGLEFAPDALTIRETAVPITYPFWCGRRSKGGTTLQPGLQEGDLVLDGFDKNRYVAYEFVSREDYFEWQTKEPACWSSVSSLNSKFAASTIRTGLESKTDKPWVGVFYEPLARATRREDYETARQTDREDLRKQVRDFIQWLKAQGVI